MKRSVRFAVTCVATGVAIAVLAAGCAKRSATNAPAGGEQPSSFPVYAPSTLVTTGKYDDSEAISKLGSGFFGTGEDEYKPYIGVQEMVKTNATLDQLDAWLRTLVQAPPPDLFPSRNTLDRYANASPSPAASVAASPGESASPSASASSATDIADPFADSFKTFGLLPAAFWTKDRGRVVMIIVLDLKQVADHMGPTLDLMDQYEKLPALVRGGIDQTVKQKSGFSISDLTNTNTPTGMIVYAARNYRNEDARVIILVDALRQLNPVPTPHETGT
jgi:hypothetical protein